MNKAFDTYRADLVAEKAAEIKAQGITAVGLYYFASSAFKVLLTRARAQKISAAGLYVFSVWENGFPTTGGYFTRGRGLFDGAKAAACALAAGQPSGTPIYFAVDYDASGDDLDGILAYFRALRPALGADGYVAGVYGSGMICRHLKDAGLAEKTWLSQSRGFEGYHDWVTHADVVQGPSQALLGMDVDTDTTNGSAGGWQVA